MCIIFSANNDCKTTQENYCNNILESLKIQPDEISDQNLAEAFR
jgi:hypothetical protein